MRTQYPRFCKHRNRHHFDSQILTSLFSPPYKSVASLADARLARHTIFPDEPNERLRGRLQSAAVCLVSFVFAVFVSRSTRPSRLQV